MHNSVLERIIMIGVSHKTHKLALESVIIMIGVSHETRNHVALKNVIIIIGVLLKEKKSNEKEVKCLPVFMVHKTLTNFVIG